MSDIKKENLNDLIDLIIDIGEQKENHWFKKKLISALKTDELSLQDEIFTNTETIKKFLNISPELSIDYSFIKHKILKNRLELDNLRMENVRLDLQEKDDLKRFYDFSIYAFYQIENMINFYYHTKYEDINTILNHLESIDDTRFRRSITAKETSISDINIATKLFSFSKTYFNTRGDYTGSTINSLRLIRNEGLHRCTVILKDKNDENRTMHNFLKYSTIESIQRVLEILTKKIELNL